MASASLLHDGLLHVCEAPTGPEDGLSTSPADSTPLFSPAHALIHGLYAHFGTAAHFALRKHIMLDYTPTLRCLASIKVGAKRWKPATPDEALALRHEVPVQQHPLFPPPPADVDVSRATESRVSLLSDFSAARHLRDRLAEVRDDGPLYARHRKVHAVLLAEDGTVLLEAKNTNAVNRVCHAEVNLLHAWWARRFGPPPRGATVLVSLKPCRMCAALLFESTMRESGVPIAIRYLEDDDGPLASGTVYDTAREARGQQRRLTC